MKANSFALFGAEPEFDKHLPIGQLYFPSWERYELSFRGIFERQYYTNQGPLTEELEEKLQQFLGVKHAICVTNATIGLMIAAEAMELSGKVILPAFTFIASAQSLTWTDLEPVFCDIDLDTHQIAIDQISALIDRDVSAIMGVNLWGGSCNPKALSKLADAHDVQLYFDSAHSFGCTVDDTAIGNFGRAEVFSFHATKVVSATEGGCICTNDDDLAARLRNIRSSYGARKLVNVVKTANGRMSEAQAAIGLLSLEDFPVNQKNNELLYRYYETQLDAIPGLHLVRPTGVSFSNYQYVVCSVDEREFGLSRDLLIEVLKAENVNARRYFYPGLHRSLPYVQEQAHYLDRLPNTDILCASCIQFPIGAFVSTQIVERICKILIKAHYASAVIRSQYDR
ncbi:dTDP-4-amino-4,6-dideoxygalactose transaminase [Nitrosospira multiformis]|uniref:dTDP-4-amino-4,6-dideoxygalactose transaminase n=1 Tax=Nitrosospira multiformis TaxID=1231 RepID=A0ABY0T5J0_9PROT|nr:DegT/DnrJ/EryC1/StrS family aminotransferase [Nitrosospira multiformis]SDQ26115.1 dTDP-4-amino-4,6-dideoxygalactose transaminase [Nitrosospira multiformis]